MSTTKRVSVVCAPTNGSNPGMSSVDLAFQSVADEAGVSDVRYWRLWDQSEWTDPPGGSVVGADGRVTDSVSGLTYEIGRGRLEEVLDADTVVFWGDFHHMAVYLQHTAHVWAERIDAGLSEREAQTLAARHLLLDGVPERDLSRVISYGTTLSFNTAADYQGPYGSQLRRFHSGVRAVSHRDSYSAEVAHRHRPGDRCKGVDAAFLLTRRTPEPALETRRRLGVFIGRSELSPEDVGRFGRRLAASLDLAPRWLPWGHAPAFWPMQGRRRLRAVWPELDRGLESTAGWRRARLTVDAARKGPEPAEPVPSFSALTQELLRCDLVLTDTYHLAVNAWSLGVPAVCITDVPRASWSVNSGSADSWRDKREDLYSQLDALPLLVRGQLGRLGSKDEVRRVVAALDAGCAAASARLWVAEQSRCERRRLVDLLTAA